MQLFYSPNINHTTEEFTFSKEESRHIVKVLRKKTGDTLTITNGLGSIFTSEVLIADFKACIVKIISEDLVENNPYHLHIAIAPTKMNDRMEWFLEKATEIGIQEISPIICDNSERKVIKLERFQKIVQSAMKQSLQAHLPKLNEARTFKQFLKDSENNDSKKCIAHCEMSDKTALKNFGEEINSLTILIGPEGDFSTNEIALAKENGYTPVSLGETRLRTETAGIVACHTIALVN